MRRSFFLLEVLIAVILVGGFAHLSIHGAFQVIHKQRKLLKAMEESRQSDLTRMKLVGEFWNKMDALPPSKDGFTLKCNVAQEGKYHLLIMTDQKTNKKYSFLITKHS